MSLAAHCALAQAPAAEDLSSALQQLKARDAEWRREDGTFRAQQAAGRLKGSEASDYAEFVAGLKLRLIEQCEAVRKLGGDAALQGYACAKLTAGGGSQPIVIASGNSARTEAETRGALISQLDRLESDIDESLLKKQQEMRERARQTAAASGGGAAGAGAGGSGSAGGGGSAGDSGRTAGGANTGGAQSATSGTAANGGASQTDAKGASGAPDQNGAATGATAAGRSSQDSQAPWTNQRNAPAREQSNELGSDDDVVARQLREAAERERDPVLKEKLWAEYKKYREARR